MIHMIIIHLDKDIKTVFIRIGSGEEEDIPIGILGITMITIMKVLIILEDSQGTILEEDHFI